MFDQKNVLIGLTAFFALAFGSAWYSNAEESSNGATSGKDIKIAILVKTLSNPYWLMLQAGANAGAKETSSSVITTGSQSELDIQGQINRVRSLITQHISAIGISPNSPAQLQPVLQQAVDASIPVIVVDTDIPNWNQKTSFIGTNNYEAGVIAGKFIASHDPQARLAIIGGTPGNPATDDRVAGLKKALEGSGVQLVAELTGYSDRSKAVTCMSDILQGHPNVNAVFAPADTMGLGIVQAIKSAGRKPADFTIVSVDGTPEGTQSILADELTASVAQNPFLMGKAAVETAVAKIQGKKFQTHIDTGASLITKSNAGPYLDKLNSELK